MPRSTAQALTEVSPRGRVRPTKKIGQVPIELQVDRVCVCVCWWQQPPHAATILSRYVAALLLAIIIVICTVMQLAWVQVMSHKWRPKVRDTRATRSCQSRSSNSSMCWSDRISRHFASHTLATQADSKRANGKHMRYMCICEMM